MRKLARLAALLALLPALAVAQVAPFPQTVPPNTVVGRLGPQSGPTQAIPFSTLSARIGNIISVKARGAVGDGVADDTAVFQSTVNAACGTAGVGGAAAAVYVPAGFYKITTGISVSCGLTIYGDGWSGDSGALLQNAFIANTSGLSGSIILPSSTIDAFTFTTNQAVGVQSLGIVYITRASAGSGKIGIKIQAANTATPPAAVAWQEGSHLDRVWVYGADINVAVVNGGQWFVTNSHITAHQTTGLLVQQPNLPYVGAWRVSNNMFRAASVVNCQHILATSGGGGHIHGNTFHSCGSSNVIPPLETSAIALIPILNVANNQFEPVTISGNTMEGLSNCVLMDGSTPSQNASLTQFAITGNQMWCVRPIDIRATATSTAWVSGGTITGNYMNAQTIDAAPAGAGGSDITATQNIRIAGANNIVISSNTFSLLQAQGGDTSTPISLGAAATLICQVGNKIISSSGVNDISSTIPLCLDGGAAGAIPVAQTASTGALWRVISGDCTITAAGVITCGVSTSVGDTNYTILSTNRTVITTASFSAPRTWTLPAASAVAAGTTIRVYDMFGAINGANTLTVARAGADTIDGQTAWATNLQFDTIDLTSDGVSKWKTARPLSGVAAAACGSATQTCAITTDLFGRVRAATATTMTSLNGVGYPSSYTSGGIPYASASGTISSSAALASKAVVIGGGAGTAPSTTSFPMRPGGRLTLTSATPVLTSTVSAATTIYYTPYAGSIVPIYDGTNFVPKVCAEISNITSNSSTGSAGPAAVANNSVYDLFVWDNAGTCTLTRGPLWTSDTARSAGTALTMVNGINLNNASITNGPSASRGTYVGTVRSNGSAQIDYIFGGTAAGGTAAFFYVWNAYNRVMVNTTVRDSTDTWNQAASSIRSANSSTTMRCSFVMGLQEDFANASYNAQATVSGSGTSQVGIGIDSTTTFSGTMGYGGASFAISMRGEATSSFLGAHFFQALESTQVGGTTTWAGDGGSPTFIQNGLICTMPM